MMIKTQPCLVATLIAFSTLASAGAALPGHINHTDGLKAFSDSGVQYAPYAQLVQQLRDLAAKYPTRATVTTYGKSLKGADLTVLRIEDQSAPKGAGHPAVEISGAIHGNEYLGIETDLAKYFLDHTDELPGVKTYLATGGVIYFIPVINPDGYSDRQRENDNGTDLNRDFDLPATNEKHFTQPETSQLASFLDQDLSAHQLNFRFAMDYHCCVGGFITPWSYKDAQPEQADLADFNRIEQYEKETVGYPSGNAQQVVGYLADADSIDYFYSKYHTRAFAIEGNYGGESKILGKHVQFFDKVLQEMAYHSLGL